MKQELARPGFLRRYFPTLSRSLRYLLIVACACFLLLVVIIVIIDISASAGLRDARARAAEALAPLTPEARITAGTRVRVRSGPLMGLEGLVEERRGQQRLVVAIEFLQQGASVLIDDYHLENIGS